MAEFSTLSGTVSHTPPTSLVGSMVKKGWWQISAFHRTDFRVDGKAACFGASANIADGDHVTLVGNLKSGEMRAVALRSNETGVVYSDPTTLFYILGGLLVLIGISVVLIFVKGFILIFIGVWLIFQGHTNQSAIKMLHETP